MEKEILDTIAVVHKAVIYNDQSSIFTIGLDVVYKIAMILIASCNLFFAFYIFNSKNKKDDHIHEKNRKIGLLKSLVLDYNMKYFYDFFDCIDKETQVLNQLNLTIEDKMKTNNTLIDLGKVLRQKFIDGLIAIDKGLYNEIIQTTDKMLDSLTESIFNEGIKLSHQPMFKDKITNQITETKTTIIKSLFSYKGD